MTRSDPEARNNRANRFNPTHPAFYLSCGFTAEKPDCIRFSVFRTVAHRWLGTKAISAPALYRDGLFVRGDYE